MPGVKKKHLVVISAVSIVAVVTLAAYFTVLSPTNDFELEINDIDPMDLSVDEYMEDFQALYDFVEENYPFVDVKNRTHGYNWLDLKSHFESQILNAQSNQDFFNIISSAIMALQNRHTHIYPPSWVQRDTTQFADLEDFRLNDIFTQEVSDAQDYWNAIYSEWSDATYYKRFVDLIVYEKGEYIVQNQANLVVTHVNGDPIDDAVMSCYEHDQIDYDFEREKNYVWSIYPRTFGDDAVFTVQNSTGHQTDMNFDVIDGWAYNPYSYPGTPFNTTVLEGKNIGYLYAGTFGSNADAYGEQVLEFYEQIEDFDHLIIDIRGNTGGFYTKWINGIVQPLIHDQVLHEQFFAYKTGEYVSQTQSYILDTIVPKDEFSYLPPEVYEDDYRIHKNWMTYEPMGEFDFNGDIVLLVDNMVYSAAEGFATFCKEFDFATIYGTPTGGDGIILRPLNFVLPNSKLMINAASAIGLDYTGNANEEVRTQPDVYYESEFGNWNELINYVIADLTNA